MLYIKKATVKVAASDAKIEDTVTSMLANIEQRGEEAVREYAAKLDNWHQDFILSDEKRATLIAQVSEQTKQDIQFTYKQVTEFARAQLASLSEFQITTNNIRASKEGHLHPLLACLS